MPEEPGPPGTRPGEAYRELARKIIAALYEEEATSREWRALRAALETRLARLEEMAAEGAPAQALRAEIKEQLQALQQEELVARFVEEALAATLAFEDLRQEMERGDEDP